MALNLGSFTEGATYAVLNDVFAEFRSDKGFARPSRYEVLLIPPNTRSSGSSIANISFKTAYDGPSRKLPKLNIISYSYYLCKLLGQKLS